MAHSHFSEYRDDDTGKDKKIFDSLKIPCNGMEISILTDPVAIEVGLQKIFVTLLEKRAIAENWQFLADAYDLCNQQQNTDDFTKKLRTFGETYFTNDALNFNKADMDLLFLMTKNNKTLTTEDLVLTRAHSGGTKSALTEVFVTFIKLNLQLTSAAANVSDSVKDILQLDIKPIVREYVKLKKEQVRLQLAACDILDKLGEYLDVSAGRLPEAKSAAFFNKNDISKALVQIQASTDDLKKLQKNMQKLLQESDRYSVSDLSDKFKKLKIDFANAIQNSNTLLESHQGSIGTNLKDEIDALKLVQANLIQAFKADIPSREIEAARAGGMEARIEQAVSNIVMVTNPLRT